MRALLPVVLLLAGCFDAPAPAPPAAPAEFPAETRLAVYTVEGNLTADAPFDPRGEAVTPKREAYWFEGKSRTVYWLSEVVKPTPRTTTVVHLFGKTTYADGNVTTFDDVRRFESTNFVVYYLVSDVAETVEFRPRPVCGDCDPVVEVRGTTLQVGEHVDLPLQKSDDGVTFEGTLRFTNTGMWRFVRVDGCRDFDACPALVPGRPPSGAA